jgi:hypothetical protein
MTFFYNSDVRLAMYVMFDLLCVMFDLLYVRVGILLICGNHLDDRYQVKSAPGHFGTYLHSQIGAYSNRHLVNSAPVMVNSAPVLNIIL